MPRRGRQSLADERVFFVTTTTKEHRHLFDSHEKLAGLKNIISGVARNHDAKLYGYVLMSNHFHLLVRLEGGGPELSAFMRDVKSLCWKELFPEHKGIWQARFDDVAVRTEKQFRVKLSYIHNNPVKVGLTNKPESYPFSSASAWLVGVVDDELPVVTDV